MSAEGTVCPVSRRSRQAESRGVAWLIGAFLICPCHLPLTLGLVATVLSGTAVGALLSGHPYLAGAVITLAWLAGTWRGIRLLKSART
jgi:Fe2+ transport system protein B